MQIKKILILLSMLFSTNSYSYDCKVKELKLTKPNNKKAAFQELRKLNRQEVVEGLLFEITSPDAEKKKSKKAEHILNYLENSEANKNQRSFFKLLEAATDVSTSKPKVLKLAEVCEIMSKVNALGASPPAN
jgi:hypothetical protein